MRRSRNGDDFWPEPFGVGSASTAGSEQQPRDHPLAVLWVPDPEQRRGWREYYVEREQKKPQGKPMGYRKGKA